MGVPCAAILMYHRVDPDAAEADPLAVSPDRFGDHLEAIRGGGFEVLALEALVAGLRSNELLNRGVAITLDDGYTDALACAAPILARHETPATFFVVGEAVEAAGPYEFWWDTLSRVFLRDHHLPTTFTVYPWHDAPTGTYSERRKVHQTLLADFYRLSRTERDDRIRAIVEWSRLETFDAASPHPLDSSGLRALADLPFVSIGAHTQSHLWLPAQPRAVQEREVSESRTALQRILARPVSLFSYPYGACDEETVAVVGGAGFDAAVTTCDRVVSAADQALLLPRVNVSNWDADEFGRHLSDAFSL